MKSMKLLQTNKNQQKGAFNNNYILMQRIQTQRLSVKENLFIIMAYVRDKTNNHEAPIKDSNGIIIEDDLSGV